MTPTRIALKPLAARNVASSSPNPSADGSYGGTLYTWLSPCNTTARPAASVIHVPALLSGSAVGPVGAAAFARGTARDDASVNSAAISRPAATRLAARDARICIVPPTRVNSQLLNSLWETVRRNSHWANTAGSRLVHNGTSASLPGGPLCLRRGIGGRRAHPDRRQLVGGRR